MVKFFYDRKEAGRVLARSLSEFLEREDVTVLALPRGGVPVGFEVAKALHVNFDLMLVRKLCLPGNIQMDIGAIALPEICVFNHNIISRVIYSESTIEHVVDLEKKDLLRANNLYRGGEPPANVSNRIVILVDDGMITGANMRAALNAVAQQGPQRIVVAVPVTSSEAFKRIEQVADDVVSIKTIDHFHNLRQAYEVSSEIRDEEVIALLDHSRAWGKGHIHFEDARRRLSRI